MRSIADDEPVWFLRWVGMRKKYLDSLAAIEMQNKKINSLKGQVKAFKGLYESEKHINKRRLNHKRK